MEILKLTENNWEDILDKAIYVLKEGGIIIYPTETCYGIGVDPTNESAVRKLISYKTHRKGKPISIAVANQEIAERFVELNETAKKFYQKNLPGPFTVISKSKGNLSQDIESQKGTLGIRIPDYEFLLNLLEKYQNPITSSSANVSDMKTPYEVEDILEYTNETQKELIGLIIDAGKLEPNPPSKLIDATTDEIKIIERK